MTLIALQGRKADAVARLALAAAAHGTYLPGSLYENIDFVGEK